MVNLHTLWRFVSLEFQSTKTFYNQKDARNGCLWTSPLSIKAIRFVEECKLNYESIYVSLVLL